MLASLVLLGAGTARPGVRNYAVEVSASVQRSPARIDFSWPADATAEHYYVFKKLPSDSTWSGPTAVLEGTATGFSDDDVSLGEAYEYSFRKSLDSVSQTVSLPGGIPLIFSIYDSWGDGMCCFHGLGAYKVSCDGVVCVEGGAFGASEETLFTAGSPEDTLVQVVVSLTLDVFAQETTWTLRDSATYSMVASGGPYEPPRFGHILAGIDCPATEKRGSVLLVVSSDVFDELTSAIERLELDLITEGHRVHRHVVSAGASVTDVKATIVAECQADPTIETLFILGHVPVPYSGDIRGAHTNHEGAWPADLYYGELDAEWTDYLVSNTSATRPANHNVPGDGKFDQTFLPSDVDLMVGRVDLSDMPAFDGDEYFLTQRYLDKNHAYRRGEFIAERRGLIEDNVGEALGLAFAAVGWRNFTAMFGAGNVHETDYLNTLYGNSYLWSYGCGGGSYTSCAGVATTSDFASHGVQTVFAPLYGSYFGDWDNENNLLRAPLASVGQPLVCFWAGCPTWHLHHMAMGHTIGYSARLSQNNNHEYTTGEGGRQIRTALMGDPTLTMHIVRPATNLHVSQTGADEIQLQWSQADDVVEGYYVYRASRIRGEFERIGATEAGVTSFVDSAPLSGSNAYMVRALKLETSGSGTYYNLSGGVVDSLATDTAVPEGVCLAPSFPNPFSPGTTIRYYVPVAEKVSLRVFTVAGREVQAVVDEYQPSGWYEVTWDGRDKSGHRAASGVYFCRLQVGDRSASRRMTVVR